MPPLSRIQLAVEFVDGVTRLELMKRADELKVRTAVSLCNWGGGGGTNSQSQLVL